MLFFRCYVLLTVFPRLNDRGKHKSLGKRGKSEEAAIEALGDQIDSLREDRQSILAEAAERSDFKERMNDMISFLDEMPQAITEYSDTITRRLVEKITIFDEKIVVEMKSGLQMEVEA